MQVCRIPFLCCWLWGFWGWEMEMARCAWITNDWSMLSRSLKLLLKDIVYNGLIRYTHWWWLHSFILHWNNHIFNFANSQHTTTYKRHHKQKAFTYKVRSNKHIYIYELCLFLALTWLCSLCCCSNPTFISLSLSFLFC